jgi:hypothetical protein
MKKKYIELINSLWWLTLLLGILIYLLFRPDNLIYNNFFSSPIKLSIEINSKLTNFLIYSLPNGLWSLSYSQLIFHINKVKSLKTILLSSVMVFFGISIEILQIHGFINGTFDFYDIFSYIILYLTIILIQK